MTAIVETDIPAIPVDTTLTSEAPANLRFYRAIWRWHFYAGLFVIPFMLILAITGSIMLFQPQLDSLMYGSMMWVKPAEKALPYTQQLAAAQTAYPNSSITAFRPADVPERTTQISLTTSDQRKLTVFVNPYTLSILGERDEDNNLQVLSKKIHGNMLIGDLGDWILELVACWGIVLTITGVYLWWPRNGVNLWGTLLPRLQSKNRRIFWRDFHAVAGFWGAVLVLFFMLTGLPWTGLWGNQFAKIWSGFPAQLWDDVPQSTTLTGSLNGNGEKVVPWAVEQMPMPKSDSSKHAEHQGMDGKTNPPQVVTVEGIPAGMPVNLDSVIALAQAKGATAGFSVSLPGDETGVYTVSPPFPADARNEVTMHIDQYSGKVLADVRWENYGLVPKLVEGGVTLHMGGWFGVPNQLLMFFGCLVVICLCIGGIIMWWNRRPAKRLGAPPMPKNMPKLWKGFVTILVISAIAFPLLGGSILIMLILDYLLISRIPVLKQAIS